MPYFIVKIQPREGHLRQPIVTNSKSESDARELVKYLHDRKDVVTVKEMRDDVAISSFGEIPENRGMICWDWVWTNDGHGDDIKVLDD